MEEKDTLYARWLSGELSPSELEQLKASGELEELQAIIDTTDQAALPAYNLDDAYGKFKKQHPSPKAKVRSLNWSYALGAAASIALLLAAFFLLRDGTTQLQAEYTANLTHSFEDGSSLVLNDGSSLDYEKGTWGANRQVHLRGEALFSVSKGAPFSVVTSNGTIQVLGTQFNVRAWGSTLYVECYEGSVRVEANGQDTVLKALQSVIVKNAKMETVQAIDYNQPLWTGGISRFFSENMDAVFAELERQFNVKIQGTIPTERFSGNFEHTNLKEALNIVCKPFGITYEIDDDQQTVFIKTE